MEDSLFLGLKGVYSFTYNLKIKSNTPYLIFLTKNSLYLIESMIISWYLMYKKKLYNMETKRFSKISSNSSQNPYLWLKQGWHKDS